MAPKKTPTTTANQSLKDRIIARDLMNLINELELSNQLALSRGVNLSALCNITDDGLINALFRYFDIPTNEDECIWCHDPFYEYIFECDVDGFLNIVAEYHEEARSK